MRVPRLKTARIALTAILGLGLSGASTVAPALAQGPVPRAGLTGDEWAGKAREALTRGATAEALEAFDHAVAVEPERVDIRLEYASALMKSGRWLRSAEHFKECLRRQPDDVAVILAYGELLNAQYQFAAAAEQFTRALRLDPGVHEREHAIVGLASARFGMEDYDAAADLFRALHEDRPNVLSAVAFLALAERKRGRLEEAERLWSRYLEADPGLARARLHQLEIQELKAAIGESRRAVEQDPGNAFSWARLGDLLRRQPDLPGALDAYAAAVRLAPGEARFRFERAVVLRDLGRWREAAGAFSGVGRDPRFEALSLYNLAYCALKADDGPLEINAWKKAASLRAEDAYAYRKYLRALARAGELGLESARLAQEGEAPGPMPDLRRALLAEVAGDPASARRAALQALSADLNHVPARRLVRELLVGDEAAIVSLLASLSRPAVETPADRHAVRLRGVLLILVGRPEEGETELERVLVEDPGDVQARVALGTAYRTTDQRDRGIATLKQAAALDPAYLYARLDLALALEQAGQSREAAAEATAAIDRAPDNPLGYAILGIALRGAGDMEKAARALDRAVALDPMDEMGAPRLLLAKVRGAAGDMEGARAALKGALPEDPEEIYRLAWQFVRDTYHDRTFNGQDWATWRDQFDGRLKTTADALGAIALMLSSLDDRDTRMRSFDQTVGLLFSRRTDAAEYDATGRAMGTSMTVESRRLDGNVGYIAVTNLDDPQLPGEIRKAAESIKSSDAVILDLRGNRGGSDDDVPQIAGMFIEPGTPTGTIVQPDGTRTATAEPSPRGEKPIIPEDKPLVVLVDRHTASSAENLAGSLRQAGRAVLVGERTFGKAGIQLPKLLPDGTTILVVGAQHADLAGDVYSGKGIRPDVTVDGATKQGVPREAIRDDPVVRKAREVLEKRKGGS